MEAARSCAECRQMAGCYLMCRMQADGWPHPKGRWKLFKSTLSLCSCYSKILAVSNCNCHMLLRPKRMREYMHVQTSEGTRSTNNSMNWSRFKWTVNTRLFYNGSWNEAKMSSTLKQDRCSQLPLLQKAIVKEGRAQYFFSHVSKVKSRKVLERTYLGMGQPGGSKQINTYIARKQNIVVGQPTSSCVKSSLFFPCKFLLESC